jgi:hypothetical protein
LSSVEAERPDQQADESVTSERSISATASSFPRRNDRFGFP